MESSTPRKRLVLKIGGSILYKENLQLDWGVVNRVATFLKKLESSGYTLNIVIGGGKISRFLLPDAEYQIDDNVKHRVGIAVTRLNAEIVAAATDLTYVLFDENANVDSNASFVMGGYKVGVSSDYLAAKRAKALETGFFIKFSQIDALYDKDPSTSPDAIKISQVNWDKYPDLFNGVEGHAPGAHMPIDLECANYCKENNLKVLLMNWEKGIRAIETLFDSGAEITPENVKGNGSLMGDSFTSQPF